MIIVQKLFPQLPDRFVAAPGVHVGTAFEIHVSAYEQDEPVAAPMPGGTGGVAVVAHAPPQRTLALETELPDQDEYEVRIYDERHGRRLVAAIELISPANKDRLPIWLDDKLSIDLELESSYEETCRFLRIS
jgi:hypothetical protein